MGRFLMVSDRRRLSRMVRRRDRGFAPSCSCEVERGAALRRPVPHVGGIRSAERALGEGPKAAFIVRLAVINSQIFSRTGSLSRRCPTCSSLRRTPRPGLPTRVWGVYSFLPSLSPEALAEDKADHVFLMVGMGCAHAGTLKSRSRSSTIFEASGPRLIKRSHQSRVRGAEPAR